MDVERGEQLCTGPAHETGAGTASYVSVFAVLDVPLDELLSARFATYRVHLPAAVRLRDRGFELLPTGLRPHYTVRLRRGDNAELGELLAALGPPVANLQYARSTIWREEGRDVPRRHHR